MALLHTSLTGICFYTPLKHGEQLLKYFQINSEIGLTRVTERPSPTHHFNSPFSTFDCDAVCWPHKPASLCVFSLEYCVYCPINQLFLVINLYTIKYPKKRTFTFFHKKSVELKNQMLCFTCMGKRKKSDFT